ncbi:MAG TPA: BamA/TamA family outer membrane protein [Gammaproteobacteria bacterium]|nr:BamA/TamA family outer membrane protein [Gammaproteobacteria bacterium]
MKSNKLFLLISLGVWLLTSNILAEKTEVKILGIQDKSILFNAKSRLSIKLKDLLKTNSHQINTLGIDEIKKAVQPYGYFNTTVTAQRKGHTVTYTVHLNEPSTIASIYIGITKPKNTPFNQNIFRAVVKKYKHHIFTQENYQNLKHDIQSKIIQQGYLFASLKDTHATVNPSNKSVDIKIQCTLNKKTLFGTIRYFGQGFSPSFLNRFAPIKTKETYNTKTINTFRNNLLKSGLFKSIRVTPDLDKNTHIIPIQVVYDPIDYYSYTIGLGLDSKQSLQLKTEVNLPRFNTRGHSVNFQIESSWTDINNKGFEINTKNQYIVPGYNPLTDQFIFEISQHSKFNQRLDDSRETEASIEFKDQKMNVQRSISLNYLYGETIPNNQPSTYSHQLYPKITINSLIPYPSIRSKVKIIAQILAASKKVSSDENLLRFLIQSLIKKDFSSGQRMYIKLEQGVLKTPHINQIPTSMKFATGGANSLRGFAYNSIGYGKYYRLLSFEIQTPIKPSWYLTGFYDAGFASMNKNATLHQSSGVGITWDTSIGNIGITAATPLKQAKKNWMIQLSIQTSI